MQSTWGRRAPLLGLLAIGLFIAGFAVGGDTPDTDAPAQEVVSFYTDNSGSQIGGAVLVAFASFFLALFVSMLQTRLRRVREGSPLTALVLGGGLTMVVGFAIFGGLTFTLADTADKLDPVAAQAINALNGDMFFPLAIGTGLFMFSTGLLTRTGEVVPGWLGWIAVVIGVAALTPVGFFALMATGLWVIAASIAMTLRAAPGATG